MTMIETVLRRCYVDGEGCWHWLGYWSSKVGPQMRIEGKARQVRRLLSDAPRGRFAHVTCGHPDCVAPSHTVLLTKAEYERAKGPRPIEWRLKLLRGRRSVATLNIEVVREIRRRLETETGKELAAEFGISRAHVSRIKRHAVWREPSPWAI